MEDYIEYVIVMLEDVVKYTLIPRNIKYSSLQYIDNNITFKTEKQLNVFAGFNINDNLIKHGLKDWGFYYDYITSKMDYIYAFYNPNIEFHALNYNRNKNLKVLLNG